MSCSCKILQSFHYLFRIRRQTHRTIYKTKLFISTHTLPGSSNNKQVLLSRMLQQLPIRTTHFHKSHGTNQHLNYVVSTHEMCSHFWTRYYMTHTRIHSNNLRTAISTHSHNNTKNVTIKLTSCCLARGLVLYGPKSGHSAVRASVWHVCNPSGPMGGNFSPRTHTHTHEHTSMSSVHAHAVSAIINHMHTIIHATWCYPSRGCTLTLASCAQRPICTYVPVCAHVCVWNCASPTDWTNCVKIENGCGSAGRAVSPHAAVAFLRARERNHKNTDTGSRT